MPSSQPQYASKGPFGGPMTSATVVLHLQRFFTVWYCRHSPLSEDRGPGERFRELWTGAEDIVNGDTDRSKHFPWETAWTKNLRLVDAPG